MGLRYVYNEGEVGNEDGCDLVIFITRREDFLR
jgi:hypothetical protein